MMTDIDYMIAVMQAAKEGKAIQRRRRNHSAIDENWRDAPEQRWDWFTFDYRVKPVEPRRIWVNDYPDGRESLARYETKEEAQANAGDDCIAQVEFVEVMK